MSAQMDSVINYASALALVLFSAGVAWGWLRFKAWRAERKRARLRAQWDDMRRRGHAFFAAHRRLSGSSFVVRGSASIDGEPMRRRK